MALSANNLPPAFNKIRLIPYHKFNGRMNMSIDYLLSSTCHEEQMPVLRFYGWEPYCLSIGYHQKSDLIDLPKLKRNGYEYVRRPTGGRAIFHAEELTYSIHASKELFNHQQLYLFIHDIFKNALRDLGFAVDLMCGNTSLPKITNQPDDIPCFTKSAWSEVQHAGKKVIGSAQKIYQKSILQHGSIIMGKLHKSLPQFLNISDRDKTSLKRELDEKTICLDEINLTGQNCHRIIAAILNQLELMTNISVNSQDLSKSELHSAEKYLNLFC